MNYSNKPSNFPLIQNAQMDKYSVGSGYTVSVWDLVYFTDNVPSSTRIIT